jgi:hypothetical protein
VELELLLFDRPLQLRPEFEAAERRGVHRLLEEPPLGAPAPFRLVHGEVGVPHQLHRFAVRV